MNTTRFRAFLVTVLLSGILSLDPPAQAGGDSSATGYVTVAREDGSLTVSFSAIGRLDAAAGQIDVHDSSPLPDQDVDGTGDPALAGSPSGVALQAEVNCLAVDGDTAIVGGEVTHSNVARYLGKQVLLFVEDSARSQGRFSWGFYEPQKNVFCGSFPWPPTHQSRSREVVSRYSNSEGLATRVFRRRPLPTPSAPAPPPPGARRAPRGNSPRRPGTPRGRPASGAG